jgi:hypothetical protein
MHSFVVVLALIVGAHLLLEFAFERWRASYSHQGYEPPEQQELGRGKLGPIHGGAILTWYEPGKPNPFLGGSHTFLTGDTSIRSMAFKHQSLSLSPKFGYRLSLTVGVGVRCFTLLIPVGR